MTFSRILGRPPIPEDVESYAKHYNDTDLRLKLKRLPRSSVKKILEKALLLRELLLDGHTPLWFKGTILGALGYLILPLDLVPDILPGAGFVDDLTVMSLVLAKLDNLVTDEIRQRVQKKMPQWLRP